MNLISYEPVSHSYFAMGEKIGNAFSDGKKLAGLKFPPLTSET